MKSTKRNPSHLRGESSFGPIGIAFIVCVVFAVNFCGSSQEERIERSNNQLKQTYEKIDRGEQLSPAEEKQLNDVLFSPTDGDN